MNTFDKISNNKLYKGFIRIYGEHKNFINITFIIVISTLYNLYFILKLPIFFYDDFTVFRIVKGFCETGKYIDINEKFLLFWRPVTFFYYIIEYILFGNNPLLIKLFILLLQILFLSSVYFLTLKFFSYFKIQNNYLIAFLTTLCINLHPVTNYYIIWISQSNSLLMTIFLIYSFYYLLKFLETSKSSFGIISAIFYLLSLLSKQHSASYPLILIILYLFFKNDIRNGSKQKIKYYIVSTLVFTLAYIVLFYLFHISEDRIYFFKYIHKKPFVIASSILYFIFPYKFLKVYDFFVYNFHFAILISVFFIIILIVLIFKKVNIINIKYIFLSVCILVASSFPHIIVHYELRNLSIQILVLFFIATFLLGKKYKKYLIIFLLACIIVYPISTFQYFNIEKKKIEYENISAKELAQLYEKGLRDFAIILSFEDFVINDHLFYLLYNDFVKLNIDNLAISLKVKTKYWQNIIYL